MSSEGLRSTSSINAAWILHFFQNGSPLVIPGYAGIYYHGINAWIPAFAGMTQKYNITQESDKVNLA